MIEEPQPPLRPQPGARRRSRATPWALVVGVVVLAVLAAILLVILVTRGSPDGVASDSGTPSPSATGSASASGSASARADGSATPAPSAAPALGRDRIVATTVAGLTLRSAPGLDAERLGSLENGVLSFVVDGPTDLDGHPWYLVSALGLPPNTGCAGPAETDPYNCPVWFGWVAGSSETGDAWLVAHEIACPEEPLTIETLAIGRTGVELLACFGPAPITVRGWWPEIPDDGGLGGACAAQEEPSGWLLCQNTNGNRIVADEDEDPFGIGIGISINPASGLVMPERGTWVEVQVHLDDPAAQDCDEAAEAFETPDRTPEQYVLDCRTSFVLESVEVVDSP